MLLSAFAYAHFVNIADPETRTKMTEKVAEVTEILGAYDYDVDAFFDDSNAMLTKFARKEITEILTVQQKQLLTIYVPAVSEEQSGERLRQWEKVAARSAAIADAFERAGQDGKMIILKMPDKLVSKANEKQSIRLTFSPLETAPSNK